MELSEKELDQFEKIWREENPGKGVSREELRQAAIKLLRVVTVVYGLDDLEGMGR